MKHVGDEYKIIDELRKELRKARSEATTYRELLDGRATKINALEEYKVGAESAIADLNYSRNNLRAGYDELLERFNTQADDVTRAQQRFDIEKSRADKNYEMHEVYAKRIVEIQTELRKANDLVIMTRNNNDHLNKVVEELKKGVYRDGGCAGCNYWETRHKKLESDYTKLKATVDVLQRSNPVPHKSNAAMHIDRENEHNKYVELLGKYDKLRESVGQLIEEVQE